MKCSNIALATAACVLTLSAAGLAQEEAEKVTLEEESEGEPEAPDEATAEEQEALAEVQSEKSGDTEADRAAQGNSPVELPGETYYFVGARYRGIVVPKFMINLFAEGGRTVYVHAFGPEFAVRKDGFEYNLGAWLGFYGMEPTALKGSSDPQQAWETIESKIKVLYLTSDFLWSHEFSPEFGLNYGMGAGLGLVFGDLKRNQTYPADPNNPGNPDDWQKCTAQLNPNPSYCDTDNEHYGNYTEPSWLGGGSKPFLFPWFALQTGLRYKPTRQFVARLDLGFGTSGFFFGLGADYGL